MTEHRAYDMTKKARAIHRARVDTIVRYALSYGDEDCPIGSKRLRLRTARNVLRAALAEIMEL